MVRVFTERGLRAAAEAVGAPIPRRAAAPSQPSDQGGTVAQERQPSAGGAGSAPQPCPSCGTELPREEGQHALAPSAGAIQCPTCGATVTLDKPGSEGGPPRQGPPDGEPVTIEEALEATERHDYFSGEGTVAGVMDEIKDKEDGGER